ncbi:small heat shock protein [Crucibulum laeve]|uniref:Small heat shock protein n=1 Tax=Crucibulum laeve TaxID=68775 RepID=A0A5C3MBC2_9AGAR|nr:small heat shock protein [Crucibulum laeve]
MSSVFYYEPFYDFERFLDDAVSSRLGSNETQLQRRNNNDGDGGAVRALKPRMDLHENIDKNSVTATFELPGLKKDDIQIDVNNNRLTVSGESKMTSDHEEGGYAVRERRYGKFSRTLQLPQGVKDNEIKARMDNGILTVTFPKSSNEQAPKRIAVN